MDDLGPVVLRCRARRRIDVLKDFGYEPISTRLVVSVLGALYLTMPIVWIATYYRVTGPLIYHPVWGPIIDLWYLGCAGLLCRYHFAKPRSEALIRYADGFRHRQRAVRFEDVAWLRVERVSSGFMEYMTGLNQVFAKFRRLNRRAAEAREIATRASVTVALKDGRSWSMNGVLLRYEKEDVERFFAAIEERRPELRLTPWEEPAPEVEEDVGFHDPALGDVVEPARDSDKPFSSGRSLIVFLVIAGIFILFVLHQFGLFERSGPDGGEALRSKEKVVKRPR